jgi:hypothetical protein
LLLGDGERADGEVLRHIGAGPTLQSPLSSENTYTAAKLAGVRQCHTRFAARKMGTAKGWSGWSSAATYTPPLCCAEQNYRPPQRRPWFPGPGRGPSAGLCARAQQRPELLIEDVAPASALVGGHGCVARSPVRCVIFRIFEEFTISSWPPRKGSATVRESRGVPDEL